MSPTKAELLETLSTFGGGDGRDVYFYDLSGKDITAHIHKILEVTKHERALMEPESMRQFIKKCHLEGIGWRQMIALWIRARFQK